MMHTLLFLLNESEPKNISQADISAGCHSKGLNLFVAIPSQRSIYSYLANTSLRITKEVCCTSIGELISRSFLLFEGFRASDIIIAVGWWVHMHFHLIT